MPYLTPHRCKYAFFLTTGLTSEGRTQCKMCGSKSGWADILASKKVRRPAIPACHHNGCSWSTYVSLVWPVIAENLEFKSRSTDAASGDGKEVTAGRP